MKAKGHCTALKKTIHNDSWSLQHRFKYHGEDVQMFRIHREPRLLYLTEAKSRRKNEESGLLDKTRQLQLQLLTGKLVALFLSSSSPKNRFENSGKVIKLYTFAAKRLKSQSFTSKSQKNQRISIKYKSFLRVQCIFLFRNYLPSEKGVVISLKNTVSP